MRLIGYILAYFAETYWLNFGHAFLPFDILRQLHSTAAEILILHSEDYSNRYCEICWLITA